MVAIFILLVCLAPTMRIFTNIYKAQHNIVRENQKDHLVHLIHAKFTEQLYQRKISLEEMEGESEITLKDDDLDKMQKKYFLDWKGKFALKGRIPKEKKHPVEYLCKLEIEVWDVDKNVRPKEENSMSRKPYEIYIYITTKMEASDEDEDQENQTERTGDDPEEEEDAEEEEDVEEEEDDSFEAKAPFPRYRLRDAFFARVG